jgi:hypothetical protein
MSDPRVHPITISLIMEAVSTFETSASFYQTTRCNNPEDNRLHTCHYGNLKSQPQHCILLNTSLQYAHMCMHAHTPTHTHGTNYHSYKVNALHRSKLPHRQQTHFPRKKLGCCKELHKYTAVQYSKQQQCCSKLCWKKSV